jgi:hypothetical protein
MGFSICAPLVKSPYRETADGRVRTSNKTPSKSEELFQEEASDESSRNNDWEAKGFELASHRPVELDMQPCSDRVLLCPVQGLFAKGILYSAYSLDISQLATKLIPEVLISATSFKRHHKSTTMLICLVTNVPTKFIDGDVIDYVIQVREDLLFPGALRTGAGRYRPQWFTRLLYMMSSPFETTLALDGNTGFCGGIDEAFEELDNYDFIVGSAAREPCLGDFPHNYIMAYKRNDMSRELFENWIIEQIKFGVPLDDQITLHRALLTMDDKHGYGFSFGIFETSFATSLLHHDNAYFQSPLPKLTRPISTPVPIIHPIESFNKPLVEILEYSCGVFNKKPGELRVILETSYGLNGLRQVVSPEECEEVLGSSCAGPVDDKGLPLACADEYNASGSRLSWNPVPKGSYIRASSWH